MSGGLGLSPRQKIAQALVDRLGQHGHLAGYERALIKGSWKRKHFYRIHLDTPHYSGTVGVMGERYIEFSVRRSEGASQEAGFVARDIPSAQAAIDRLCSRDVPSGPIEWPLEHQAVSSKVPVLS